MTRPFETIQPGEGIPPSDYNRRMEEISRGDRWVSAAPLVITNDVSGFRVSILDKPVIWVRITGHFDHSGGMYQTSTPDANLSRYSGIEQTDSPERSGTYDLSGGIEFYVDQMYLKEVNGRTDIPEGVIVRAYQSNNGDYYTFQLATVPVSNITPAIIAGGNNCPIWNCFVVDSVNPYPDECPAQYWTNTQDGPPADVTEFCGCTPLGAGYPNAGCWPYWRGMDLSSTGISLNCLIKNFGSLVAIRNACLVLVPGGPFGLRLALISYETGREYTFDSQPPS